MAREALTVIIRLAGQAPFRLRPLSSNVRPHGETKYAEITAAIQSVKTVAELAKAANSLSNYNELIAAVSEVNSKLMDATAVALASQERQSELLNRIALLEKELADVRAKQAKAERYALHKFPTGALAYKLRELLESEEPAHYACAKCVDNGGHTKLHLISDEPQQAHLVSYQGLKMGSPPQEVNREDEPSAVSTGTFDGRVHGSLRQR